MSMTILPGDYIAGTGMLIVLALLIIGHVRAIRAQRRAQRELDRRLGHPARHSRQDSEVRP